MAGPRDTNPLPRPLRPIIALLTAVAVLTSGRAARAQSQLAPALTARVDSALNAAVAAGETAGISVAVARGDRVVYANAFGAAVVAPRRPATERTVYRIGSLTAQFTAAAVLQLVDDGKLSLDDPVARYVAGAPPAWRAVVIRQLLNHTSGIPSYTSLGARWERSMSRDVPPDSIIALVSGAPLDFQPGAVFRYNNTGFFLLGLVIERASGERYADYVRRHLAEPLGLTSLHYCGAQGADAEASGYSVQRNRYVPAAPVSMTHPFSAGALCASARDLARWPALLAAGRVIPAATYARMTTPDTLTGGRRLDYGYGVRVRDFAGRPVLEHGGGINGFASQLSFFPRDSLTIAVVANTETLDAQRLERLLARMLLPGATPRDVALTPAAQEVYAGSYVLGRHLPVRIWIDRGRLTADADGQPTFRLLYQGGNLFAASFDPEVTLAFSVSGGRATGFVLRQAGETTEARRVR